jgi:hypothetical protein
MSSVNIEFFMHVDDRVYLNHDFEPNEISREPKLYIRISPPGEFGNVIERPATDRDKKTHARQWEQFERGEPQVVEGEPIEKLAALYPNGKKVVAVLEKAGVFTLEQLAGLSGHAIDTLGGGMGGQKWVTDGKRLLAEIGKGVSTTDYKRDIERLEARIRALEAYVAASKLSSAV